MAKKNNPPVEIILIFDGLNWVESLESTFDFENNTFDNVDHPVYHTSISIEALEGKVEGGNVIMRYNLIQNTPIAIQLFKSANCI